MAKLTAMFKEYGLAYPTSLYPAYFEMSTHITPNDRIKKVFLTFPSGREELPAIVCTVYQHNGSHTDLRVRVVNMVFGSSSYMSVKTSEKKRMVNRDAIDKVVACLKKQVWSVGDANPDHLNE